MVHPYLRRRMGLEDVAYPNDEIRDVLHKTLGVPIFQEQAMRLAVVAAGFTPGEADQLRRAMGAWRRQGVIDQFRKKLLDGMSQRGLPRQFADQVFRQIRGFGEYGFPESHAASFALLVYVSAWLKHYYPAAFAASLINSQPMGFYAPAQLVRDAREHGVELKPIDVNHSYWDCALEGSDKAATGESRGPSADAAASALSDSSPQSDSQSLRLGFRLLVGFSQRHAEVIERVRQQGRFTSVDDFSRRTKLSQAVIQRLSEADVFRSLGRDRREALWEALAQPKRAREMPLLEGLAAEVEAPVALPRMDQIDQVFHDYASTGLSLKAHPISFYREPLDGLGVKTARELSEMQSHQPVCVAGLVILRQRPSTAKGITFVTLEDETGIANLVIHTHIWKQFYTIARRSPAWIAHGRLESKYSVIHVVVRRLEDLAQRLRKLNTVSRDFR